MEDHVQPIGLGFVALLHAVTQIGNGITLSRNLDIRHITWQSHNIGLQGSDSRST